MDRHDRAPRSQVSASVLLPTMRCIMTTLPQSDLPKDNDALRTVSRHNRIDVPGLGKWSCVGAYAKVTVHGRIATGTRGPASDLRTSADRGHIRA